MMRKLALLATFAIATTSFGQAGFDQPWNLQLPAWASVVYSCSEPVPTPVIAADDFTWTQTTPVTRINWWGVVSNQAQLSRPYYIAIYKQTATGCRPNWQSIVWKGCLLPLVTTAGTDCQNRVVWFFRTTLPTPLTLPPGQPYWIQISESDKDSFQPGATDFWWSAHQPLVNCGALQLFNTGAITSPLPDPCNGKKDDLAFQIL